MKNLLIIIGIFTLPFTINGQNGYFVDCDINNYETFEDLHKYLINITIITFDNKTIISDIPNNEILNLKNEIKFDVTVVYNKNEKVGYINYNKCLISNLVLTDDTFILCDFHDVIFNRIPSNDIAVLTIKDKYRVLHNDEYIGEFYINIKY